MLSRKGQCKWTCRLTPFRITFILLHHLIVSVNIFFSFIWAKISFSEYCSSVLFQCIRLQNLHTRKKGTVCHREVFAPPGDMACLVCFVNSLILAYHPITRLFSTNSATMLIPTDVIYSWHHHALSKKNILKIDCYLLYAFLDLVYHLDSFAKFTHTTEANILLG